MTTMDPSPKSFPILSYVMSRLNSSKSQSRSTQDYDIEQPQIQDHRPHPQHSVELIECMPHLSDPIVLASMKSAVAEVAQTRSVLQTLGDRPDHETLDLAKSRLAEVDAELSKNLADIVLANRPDDVDVNSWPEIQAEKEKECRLGAESEKAGYKAVVQLDEMHEAYERLLREAEEKLVRIYEGHNCDEVEGDDKEKVEVNEEVVGILNEAAGKCVERVTLSARGLRILPEAFGRMKGLVSLDVSNNQLEVRI